MAGPEQAGPTSQSSGQHHLYIIELLSQLQCDDRWNHWLNYIQMKRFFSMNEALHL